MVKLQKSTTDKGCPLGTDQCCVPHDHELDLVLCANLESLADTLPALPPTTELRHLTERLQLATVRWASYPHPVLASESEGATSYRLLDSIHAEDVIEAIWNYWRQPQSSDAERLAYMLRALFDGRRRAIVIERLMLGCSHCQYSATA